MLSTPAAICHVQAIVNGFGCYEQPQNPINVQPGSAFNVFVDFITPNASTLEILSTPGSLLPAIDCGAPQTVSGIDRANATCLVPTGTAGSTYTLVAQLTSPDGQAANLSLTVQVTRVSVCFESKWVFGRSVSKKPHMHVCSCHEV